MAGAQPYDANRLPAVRIWIHSGHVVSLLASPVFDTTHCSAHAARFQQLFELIKLITSVQI